MEGGGTGEFESGPALPNVRRAIDAQPWDSLIPHLLKTGVDVDATTRSIKQFTELLLKWNRGISNLISRNDEPRVVERHIVESIEPAHWLKSDGASRWIDFGSGGGLPAVPLAMAGVGDQWVLVESRRTKTLFLKRVVQDLRLDNVTVINERLEDFVLEEAGPRFDGFTSRATLRLVPTLELAARLVVPGGHAFLWKGSRREEEMAEDSSWQNSWELDGLLGIAGGRTVVVRFTRKA